LTDGDYLRGVLCFGGFGQMAIGMEHPSTHSTGSGQAGSGQVEQRVEIRDWGSGVRGRRIGRQPFDRLRASGHRAAGGQVSVFRCQEIKGKKLIPRLNY